MSHPSPRLPRSARMRWTLLGMTVAAVAGSPFAVAQIADRTSVIAGTRTPITGELFKPTTLATNVPTHGLAVTNESNRGAAALLTCRSITGDRRRACLRAVNQRTGLAFQFGFRGALGGLFQVGSDLTRTYPDARPFATNALGVATGLNADRVDGFHAQDIIDAAVARASVQIGPQGPPGAQGAQGARGAQGPQGQSGPPGTPLVAAESTDANGTYGGRTIVDLRNEPLNSSEPDSAGDGSDLLPNDAIALDPGTYVVQTTFKAFDVLSEGPDPTIQYGVAALFLDGQRISTLMTSDIPVGNDNFAMASDTTVIGVPTGAGGVISVRGVVRQNATASGGSTAEGGVSVIVTEVNAG